MEGNIDGIYRRRSHLVVSFSSPPQPPLILSVNRDTYSFNIYNGQGVRPFYWTLQEGEHEFLFSVRGADARTAPSWEPSSSFSSYLSWVIYVNATKSLTILPAFSTAHGQRRNSSPWNAAGSSLIACEDHNSRRLSYSSRCSALARLFLGTVSVELASGSLLTN